MTTTDLVTRLAALEARVPAPSRPALPVEGARRRRLAPIALAPVLVLALAATAVAGGAIVGRLAEGHPGIENPGQPMAGAGMACMTPPEAAAALAAHGFTRVDWQVERGDIAAKTGTSTHQATAPEHGFVIPGSVLEDGSVIMVVDQRVGATGAGDCAGERMP
jgi:hypothetical protein